MSTKKTIIGLLSLSFIAFLLFPHEQKMKTPPIPEMENPGWVEDLKIFQYRESDDIPQNLNLYYRKTILGASKVALREGTGLENQRELGPSNISGRSRAYMIDRLNPDHHFAGSVSGGLWESWDAGEHWEPQSDRDQNLSVSFIDQNPFNPDVIYYSTGEAVGNSANLNGIGIFKSTDRGKSFELLPASQQNEFFRTWRIVCSKTDAQTLYIGSNKGFYRSIDGGESFELIRLGDCQDIEVLEDSTVFYTLKGAGIFRVKEANPERWEHLKLPEYEGKNYQRIEIAVCAHHPNYMYAALEDNKSTMLLGILRSEDGGEHWVKASFPPTSTNYAWYTHTLQVHPDVPDLVLYGNIGLVVSYNGGKSWKSLLSSHADKHLFYFDPTDSDHMIATHDGGIDEYYYLSGKMEFEGTLRDGFNVTQYYAGDCFPNENRVIAGAQDNGTSKGTDRNKNFTKVFGGDGGYCAVNYDAPNNVVWEVQRGPLFRTRKFGTSLIDYKDISNEQIRASAYFINPFYMNRSNSEELIYITAKAVWFTPNFGDNWYPVDSNASTLYAGLILEKGGKRYVFAGGRLGKLNRYDNLNPEVSTPTVVQLNKTQPTFLKKAFLRAITLDHSDSTAVIVCFSSYSDQHRVWKVENAFGDNPVWVDISGDLPKYLPVNDVASSVIQPDKLAIGTRFGLFTTSDGGSHWQRDTVIPNVPVFQVKIRPRDNKLFAFTHGRGAWMADFPIVSSTKTPGANEASLRIMPNPVRGFLRWEQQKRSYSSYEIVNRAGSIILRGKLSTTEHFIAVGTLNSGMYYIVLYDAKGNRVVRSFMKY